MNDHATGPENEIDLYELLLLFRKRYKLIASVFLLAVVLTAAVSFLMPPMYESGFVVKTPATYAIVKGEATLLPLISPAEIEEIVGTLDRLLEEERAGELATKLGIGADAADGIISLKVDAPRDKVARYVVVSLEVRDPLLVRPLTEGLLQYLNDIEYVKKHLSLRRESIEQLEEEILAKITKMENLSAQISGQIMRGDLSSIGFNPLELDKVTIDLRRELEDLEGQLQLLSGFEVAVDPVVPQKPGRPRPVLYAGVAGMAGLFMGAFFVFFIELVEARRRQESS